MDELPFPSSFVQINSFANYLIQPSRHKYDDCKYQEILQPLMPRICISYLKNEIQKNIKIAEKHRKAKVLLGFVKREGKLLHYEKLIMALILIMNYEWCSHISTIDITKALYVLLPRKPSTVKRKINNPKKWLTAQLCGVMEEPSVTVTDTKDQVEDDQDSEEEGQGEEEEGLEQGISEANEAYDQRRKADYQRKSGVLQRQILDKAIEIERQRRTQAKRQEQLEARSKFLQSQFQEARQTSEQIEAKLSQIATYSFEHSRNIITGKVLRLKKRIDQRLAQQERIKRRLSHLKELIESKEKEDELISCKAKQVRKYCGSRSIRLTQILEKPSKKGKK